ncbi:MAG TPA: putative sugar O-methyltransferase [Bacteroidales bacterium]|nr:putative sugar O-methyltransferase [Bacteroidales bacterium]
MIDYNAYLNVCRKAVVNEDVFKNFKRHQDYTPILEHVSFLQGLEYLTEIGRDFPYLLRYINKFATNDHVGNPRTYHTKEIEIEISPTTLRYIKVLADLMNIFGRLDTMKIVEIGVGYGGQCKIINDIVEWQSYTLVDLPDVLVLAEKYLHAFGITNIKTTLDEQYDLCISNYAFTEIDRSYQNIYAEKIIKKSLRGYITCNFLGQRSDGAMSKDEIHALNPGGKFIPEKPLTGENNVIYTWQ